MAVNKNFVVKNGLEVSTDLIFADASTEKVGIGSTIPSTQLDVVGGIAVTDINVTGVGTIVSIKGTTADVPTVVATSLQATNLNITGVATGIEVTGATNFLVTGITSTGSLQVVGTGGMPVGIITNAQGTNVNYSGIGTIATLNSTTLVAASAKVSDLTDNRVVVAGSAGELEDSANLTFDGTQLTGTGNLKITGVGTIANVIMTADASGLGATVGAAVGVVTYYGDGVNLTNVSGQGVGVRTTGAIVGYGFTILNFIGAGNTFAVDGKTVDISIAGGGGGGSVSIGSEAPESPSSGSLWYHTEYGRTFVYYDEVTLGIGNTAVWVDAAPFNQGGQFINKYGDNALGAIGYTGGTTSQASIYYTGDPNTGIYFPAADHVGIVAGGTKSLEVNPNGATVTGVTTVTGDLSIAQNLVHTGDTDTKLYFGTDNIYFDTAGAERMQITGVGTVGIGTNRPELKLHVGAGRTVGRSAANSNCTVVIEDRTNTGIQFFSGTQTQLRFGDASSTAAGAIIYQHKSAGSSIDNFKINFSNSGYLTFNDGGGENLRFTPNNEIGVAGANYGDAGQVLTSGGSGAAISWSSIAAGGSGEFNTSISGATQYDVTTSMAAAYTANASSDHRTIVHSIHICNISASEASISGEIQASFSIAHNIPVPAGSAVELL